MLLLDGYGVQIETSGTQFQALPSPVWVTLSPKLNMPGGLPVLDSMLERADEIKYPISSESHLEDLKALLNRGVHKTQEVWLQPLSQNAAATQRCVGWAIENGFNLSLQTHKFIDVR